MADQATDPSPHTPVLLERVVELLTPALRRSGPEQAVLIDATVGLGGHTQALLDRCPNARVIGLDRDRDALEHARDRLASYQDRVLLVHAVYDELADVLARQGSTGVDAVLFDLGVSSLQLDQADRGFAYRQDAPLDMRMDQTEGQTAAELVNTASVDELTTILRRYGEEPHARRIARAIVNHRAAEPMTSSEQLVEVVRQAVPAAARRSGHPAKRTFQALRIAVNDELGALERVLPDALAALRVGGRLVVLSYQSLEDRPVKQAFAAATTADVPPGLPVVPADREPAFRLLTRGAERPSADENEANPRAASARLRAVERVRA